VVLIALSVLARIAVAALVLGAGVGAFVLLASSRVEPEQVERGDSAVPVRTVLSTVVPMPRVFDGYGTARSMDAVVVASQVAARVVERPEAVEAGAPVEQGALLVRLDETDIRSRIEAGRQRAAALRAQLDVLTVDAQRVGAQVALAEEEVELARRDLERVRDAASSSSATQADVDQRVSSLRRSERELESLRQRLDSIPARRAQLEAELASTLATLRLDEQDLVRTAVTAPMAGVLQSVEAEPGEYVRVGDAIARVVDQRRVEVPLRLALSAAGHVAVGDPVTLRADNDSGSSWPGAVARIAPEADAASRTLTVFVEVEASAGGPPLLPGQFVTGRVESSERTGRLVVPRRAVNADRVLLARGPTGETPLVEAVNVRVSHYIEGELPDVEPGETQWAVIGDGLAPGERVIVTNLDDLIGGMPVAPTPAVEAESGVGG
jgi:RND family efflux transporter MFP subunit